MLPGAGMPSRPHWVAMAFGEPMGALSAHGMRSRAVSRTSATLSRARCRAARSMWMPSLAMRRVWAEMRLSSSGQRSLYCCQRRPQSAASLRQYSRSLRPQSRRLASSHVTPHISSRTVLSGSTPSSSRAASLSERAVPKNAQRSAVQHHSTPSPSGTFPSSTSRLNTASSKLALWATTRAPRSSSHGIPSGSPQYMKGGSVSSGGTSSTTATM